MDEIKPITNQGFFSYVFKLSKFKQADLLNFIQYCMISIIPFILIYYFIKKFSFSITYKDSSLYILSITFLSIIAFTIGIFFIDRIVNYIPALSGKFYDIINITNMSIVIIMLLLIVRSGYLERTSILLSRFDAIFNRALSSIGIKNPPIFDIYNHESNNYSYQVAFYKARNKAIELGESKEKAEDTAHAIVDKLKVIKRIQQTTDAQRILELSKKKSSNSLGTSSSEQSTMNTLSNMKEQSSTSMSSSQNPMQNISTSGMSTTNPYAKKGNGMSMGMGMEQEGASNEPVPANSVPSEGFSTW